MRARARVHGAISIVNAIPTGRGAAMGIDLWTEAEVSLRKNSGIRVVIEDEPSEDTRLAEKVVKTVLERAGLRSWGAEVRTRSNIPIGRGLKSSSAASNAVAMAAVKAAGLSLSSEEVVKLAVEASIEAGVSITGAYDDAYTSFFGGVNITDNEARRVLRRMDAPEDVRVLILVPDEKVYTAGVDVEALKDMASGFETALSHALEGRLWEAMTMNGFLVASALKQDTRPMIQALRAGAEASGVSGTGPAVAAVVKPDHLSGVRSALESFGRVLEAGVNNRGAEVWL